MQLGFLPDGDDYLHGNPVLSMAHVREAVVWLTETGQMLTLQASQVDLSTKRTRDATFGHEEKNARVRSAKEVSLQASDASAPLLRCQVARPC